MHKLRDVFHQTIERIVARVDSPNDFIEATNRIACSGNDSLDVTGNRFGFGAIGFSQFTEKSNPRQAGTEIVVNVFGNASAFPFDGVLLFETADLALHSLPGDVTSDARHAGNTSNTH